MTVHRNLPHPLPKTNTKSPEARRDFCQSLLLQPAPARMPARCSGPPQGTRGPWRSARGRGSAPARAQQLGASPAPRSAPRRPASPADRLPAGNRTAQNQGGNRQHAPTLRGAAAHPTAGEARRENTAAPHPAAARRPDRDGLRRCASSSERPLSCLRRPAEPSEAGAGDRAAAPAAPDPPGRQRRAAPRRAHLQRRCVAAVRGGAPRREETGRGPGPARRPAPPCRPPRGPRRRGADDLCPGWAHRHGSRGCLSSFAASCPVFVGALRVVWGTAQAGELAVGGPGTPGKAAARGDAGLPAALTGQAVVAH